MRDDALPGTWSWIKEWTGYIVTILPYVSSAIILIPQISIWPKLAILCVFGGIVLFVRIFHEKAGIEVTGSYQRGKETAKPLKRRLAWRGTWNKGGHDEVTRTADDRRPHRGSLGLYRPFR